MIKKAIGKKVAQRIESSRYGQTMAGRTISTVLDEDKMDAHVAAGDYILATDLRSRRTSLRVAAIAWGIAAVSWISIIFLTKLVAYLVIAATLIFSKGGMLLLTIPLASALAGTYALFRLWMPELENETQEQGPMQSYQYQSDSLKVYRVWLVCSSVGAVNALSSFFAYTYFDQ